MRSVLRMAIMMKNDRRFANIYTSDFSGGADGWTGAGGAVGGNIDTIGGQDNNLRLTLNAVNSVHYLNKASSFAVGKTYHLRFDYYIPGGQSNVDGMSVWSGGHLISTEIITDSWTNIDIYITAASTLLRFYAWDGVVTTFQDAGGDDVFYIRNVIIDQLVG